MVTNQYFLAGKTLVNQALDLVTLPVRLMASGQPIDLTGKKVTVLPHIPGYDTAVARQAICLSAFVFCAYFYRYAITTAGFLTGTVTIGAVTAVAFLLKFYSEAHLVRSRFSEIEMGERPPEVPKVELSMLYETTGLPTPSNLHPNKAFLYDKFVTKSKPISDIIKLTVCPLNRDDVKGQKLFSQDSTLVIPCEGHLVYDHSVIDFEDWTANFSTAELFRDSHGSSPSLSDIQVVEHPALYHLKEKLQNHPEMEVMRGDQVALIRGTKQYGVFDASKCDGREFGDKIPAFFDPYAMKLEQKLNSLFCFVAPNVAEADHVKPYRKEDLEKLFYRAYNAFSNIKAPLGSKKVRIHTGNWGCGTQGNSPRVVALIQIAAAYFAGVEELCYYARQFKEEFNRASEFYKILKKEHPEWTVDEFLEDMAARAKVAGFIYHFSDRD